MTTATAYRIHVEHHYYAGQINAPRSGYVSSAFAADPMADEYPAREAAEAVLREAGMVEGPSGEWSPAGRYYLASGEYALPTYTIRRVQS